MFQKMQCKSCPYKKDIDAIEVGLVNAEHISACHKLEVNEQFYLDGKLVKIKEITDVSGNKVKVLAV